MPEKNNTDYRKTQPYRIGAVAILVIGVGGAVAYKLMQGAGLIKDKADKDFEALARQDWMNDYNNYLYSRISANDELCITPGTDWGQALIDFEFEFNSRWYYLWATNEEALLGYVKKYIKSRFDFAYMSMIYYEVYGDDFPSSLEYHIDATWDDIAMEHLNRYLKSIPDTTVKTCKCDSQTQKDARDEAYIQDDGNTSRDQILKNQYCK